MNKNAAFFLSEKGRLQFPELLKEVQSYFSEQYKDLLNSTDHEQKEMIKPAIRRYLTENRLGAEGMGMEEAINRLYTEMAEYSFLTPYLNYEIKDVEGIEINSWDCIWVKFTGGRIERAKGRFLSPEHAKNVMARLLEQSHIHMDNSKPLARGHIGKNIRVTVNGNGGTLDEDTGVAASIRFVNPSHLTKQNLLDGGTLTPEMMDFLVYCYRYGLSMMLSGETDAGKTTLMSIIMAEAVLNLKKLITIENGTREFDLIKRDPKTKEIINSIIHLVTRESDDPKQAITQQMLLEWAMTMNPDFLCMAEVKGSESFETVEAALTGHPVIGTTHVFSAGEIPDRLVQLASLKGSTLSDKTLYSMVVRAFPILFYAQKMEDDVRRVTEICECQLENGELKILPLWNYEVQSNEVVNGKTVIHGGFVKCGVISKNLQQRLRRKGMPEELLQRLLKI
ncbi:Type II/IV secretion system protein [Caprobacter fermentans]|uniref:Type II/IV secretion system protein n=1 Tax=Caproicibacter fermentans TaxID=2576756 RepID=A0A6N8HX60_9FIRM|nr:CpaF/VirB11 family protein [Caproicibacter fermentans]MVB10444.1 Type II/IV secretion system protein [Caproicibacter fermentans]